MTHSSKAVFLSIMLALIATFGTSTIFAQSGEVSPAQPGDWTFSTFESSPPGNPPANYGFAVNPITGNQGIFADITQDGTKVIATYTGLSGKTLGDLDSINYNTSVETGTGPSLGWYINIYTKDTPSGNWFDCRYDYQPPSIAPGNTQNVVLNNSTTWSNIDERNGQICGTAAFDESRTILAIAFNMGDTSSTYTGTKSWIDTVSLAPDSGGPLDTGTPLTFNFVIEVTPPPSTTSPSAPRAPEVSPITFTGDLQSTTSFQLVDGTRVSYDGTTGIITVVFPNGSSRTVGFPGRITDNRDGTLNVFDETGDAFVDRVIITGRGGEIVTSAPQQTTNAGGAQVRDVAGCTVTTQNIMNLRAEPSVNSTDLDDVAFATPLSVSQVATVPGDPNSPWYRVTYNGQTGWIAGPFVTTSGTC